MENQVSSISLIPGDLRSRYSGDEVIEAGWAAGPSFIVRKTNRYSRPVTLSDACGWLENYREIFRACHIALSDRSVIWMHRNSFYRYDTDDFELRDSGTFIDAGNRKVDISKRLNLSEELLDGRLSKTKTVFDPFLHKRRRRDIRTKNRHKRKTQ